jgi:hypothetical protein
MDQYDVIVAPALAEAPVLLDEVDWRTDDPMGLFTRSGASPFTATSPASRRLAAGRARGLGRRSALRPPVREATCWPSPRSSSGAAVEAVAGFWRTAPAARAADPSTFGVIRSARELRLDDRRVARLKLNRSVLALVWLDFANSTVTRTRWVPKAKRLTFIGRTHRPLPLALVSLDLRPST